MTGASAAADRPPALPESSVWANRPLRVCYVCGDYPVFSDGKSGGIGTHTHALVNAISDLGHEVTVIARSSQSERVLEGRVTLRRVPLSSSRQWKLGRLLPVSWLRWSFAANRALRELHDENRFDLVVLPDAYGEGFRFALDPFLPFVVRFGGPASIIQRCDGRSTPVVRHTGEERMERLPPSRASLLVCASRPFAELISREWTLDLSRFRFIRNPVDLRRFAPCDRTVEFHTPLVLFAGHVQPLKGVRDLVDAVPLVLRNVSDVRFRIVGNDTKTGPNKSSFRAHLEHHLRGSGTADHMEFVGTVPQAELVSMYRQCAVLVLPSHNDVYPNAVLEAMGCGRPCIVTSTTGVAELIERNDCGRVVPPANPAALAAAITDILRLPKEWVPARVGSLKRCARRRSLAVRPSKCIAKPSPCHRRKDAYSPEP